MSKKQRNKQNKKRPQIVAWLWITFLVIAVTAFISASFLLGRWLLNAAYVASAKLGKPQPVIEMLLMGMNFPDGYVVHYNFGNYCYSHGYYEAAEESYNNAISSGIPYGKECPVKVNLALSLLNQISDSQWESFLNAETVDDLDHDGRLVQETLLTAKSYLTEDGCAHDEDEDGHYEQAQILKDEIDELIKQDGGGGGGDEGQSSADNSEENENENESDSGKNESAREDKIKESIQNQKEKNQKERAEDRQYLENNYGLSEDEFKGDSGGGGSDNKDSDGEGGGSPGNGENNKEDEYKIW